MLHTPGYGMDEFTAKAANKIKSLCDIPDGAVYFVEGGTQANMVTIDRLLDKNDGVLAADTSHIAVHEAGAIEACGHKIITLANKDGKISAAQIDRYMTEFINDDTNHYMVRPAMVYISFPTELGTLYSKEELCGIKRICNKYSMPLYIDGARMAYGLAASDLTLKEIAEIADIFYIGGTKCGALFGEAIVATRNSLLPRFISLLKLRGATLAKGRLLGVQFDTLFNNELYARIGKHAVEMAMALKSAMTKNGINTFIDSPTNQQFFVMPNGLIKYLKDKGVSFQYWGCPGEKESPVRFVTDWATTHEDINEVAAIIARYQN